MATWQFDFHLVPAATVERHFRTVPLTIAKDEFDRINWWRGSGLCQNLEQDLSTLLPRAPSWSTKIISWGQEDGDRFDVMRDEDGIVEVFGRLDVRTLSLPFISRVLELAGRRGLFLATEDRHVLRPSLKELLSAIHRSRSFAFVTDPDSFLRELMKKS